MQSLQRAHVGQLILRGKSGKGIQVVITCESAPKAIFLGHVRSVLQEVGLGHGRPVYGHVARYVHPLRVGVVLNMPIGVCGCAVVGQVNGGSFMIILPLEDSSPRTGRVLFATYFSC